MAVLGEQVGVERGVVVSEVQTAREDFPDLAPELIRQADVDEALEGRGADEGQVPAVCA